MKFFFGSILLLLLLGAGVFGTMFFREHRTETSEKIPADKVEDERISVFIVPHHLLAKDDIEAAFQSVSSALQGESIGRVVLLSPNHFDVGTTWMVSSERTWDTPSGSLIADTRFVDTLQKDDITVGENILEREHGVRNLLPFVKEYFPRALLVPLALRDGIPDEKTDALARQLNEAATHARTVVIVSADFSHYLDWNFSRFHDNRSIASLENFDLAKVRKLDVDCAGCLRVALQYAELQDTQNFHLVARTSSLESAGKNLVGEETSHITGYFSSRVSEKKQEQTVDLLFSGDIPPELMTENARRLFMGQDGNIFDVAGKTVFSTESFLPHQQGFVADGDNLVTTGEEFSVREINGKKVAFVSIGEDMDVSSATVKRAKTENDVVIAYWERALPDQSRWTILSHALVDAGADLVIGRQNAIAPVGETYQGRAIFSSLGNPDLQCRARTHCLSLIIGVSFSSSNEQYSLMPVEVHEAAVLATGPFREGFLKELGSRVTDVATREAFERGAFTLISE